MGGLALRITDSHFFFYLAAIFFRSVLVVPVVCRELHAGQIIFVIQVGGLKLNSNDGGYV